LKCCFALPGSTRPGMERSKPRRILFRINLCVKADPMPYADPDRARDYHREYRRLRRAGDACSTPGQSSNLPVAFRLQTSQDIIDLLQGQVTAVLASKADAITKARTVAYIASVSLRAIEAGNVAARVEELERVLKGRDNGGGA
jgi:hypothetical protein